MDDDNKNPRAFIVYAQGDDRHSDRVLRLAQALRRNGIAAELDQFHAHEVIEWPAWCEQQLQPQHSDWVLMVCSASYRERIEPGSTSDPPDPDTPGKGVHWEGRLIRSQLYDARGNRRVIPVLLGDTPDTRIPAMVAGSTRVRLRGFDLADPGFEDLLRMLSEQPGVRPEPTGTLPRLGPRRPMSELATAPLRPVVLPYPSLGRLFKGRESLLDALHRGFAAGESQAITARHAIHGLGGIGKTRLAVEYAWRHIDDYSALLLVTADSPANFEANLAALCGPLGVGAGLTEQPARLAAVLDWLADPAHHGWLLILDNLDDADSAAAVDARLATLGGGRLLLTGRLDDWPAHIQARPIDVLAPEPAAAFLLERSDGRRRDADDDRQQALALAGELGGLALALEQAAGYIRRHRIGLADYLARWRTADRRVRGWHDPRTMQYQRPLLSTWQTSVERLDPPARALLDLLAWLGPEPLPAFLFDHRAVPEDLAGLFDQAQAPTTTLAELSADANADADADADLGADPEAALAALRELSLLQPADEAGFPSPGRLHRVLALITREQQTAGRSAAALTAALALTDAAAVGDAMDVRHWPLWEPLAPHLATLLGLTERRSDQAPVPRLLNDLALLHHARARHRDAEPLTRRALAIDEATLGDNHPDVAIRLNNLSGLLLETDRLTEAEALMRRALAISEAVLGGEHPSVARNLNNLAQLLQTTDRLTEAEPLQRRALAIDEAVLGSEHPAVARDLHNLAQLLIETNRVTEAEPLQRRALAIDEAVHGSEHPRVAIHLISLAQLLQATNRLNEAEPLQRRALAIDEAALGGEHPAVARDLNNLAQLLQATDRLIEAEPLMRRALMIFLGFTRATGHRHPHLIPAIDNYRGLLAELDESPDAITGRLSALAAEAGLEPGVFDALLTGIE